MITLTTGQPGAGKTLYTLWQIEQLAEKEQRPVYYSGINDLKLPWYELEDPKLWYECPTGAIIVIDECQRVFRPRGNGSKVPDEVAKMETHRHNGHDLFLITQHPMLLDSNIRRLVGRHQHVVRAFGAKAANIHEWGEVREQCDKNRANSQETFWKYPAAVFNYYKSAELHTHKFRLPPRIYFLLLAPILIFACIYAFYAWYKTKSVAAVTPADVSKPQESAKAGQGKKNSRLTAAEYLAEQEPRIVGLPHTAPMYDDVTKATEAPIPAGCVDSKKTGCKCYTQQGTRYDTTEDICRSILAHGFYVPWKREEQGASENREEGRAKPDNGAVHAVLPDTYNNGSNALAGGFTPEQKRQEPTYLLKPAG